MNVLLILLLTLFCPQTTFLLNLFKSFGKLFVSISSKILIESTTKTLASTKKQKFLMSKARNDALKQSHYISHLSYVVLSLLLLIGHWNYGLMGLVLKSARPDLQNFATLAKKLNVFGQFFEWFILYWQTFLPTLAFFILLGIVVNDHTLINNIAVWHTDWNSWFTNWP